MAELRVCVHVWYVALLQEEGEGKRKEKKILAVILLSYVFELGFTVLGCCQIYEQHMSCLRDYITRRPYQLVCLR